MLWTIYREKYLNIIKSIRDEIILDMQSTSMKAHLIEVMGTDFSDNQELWQVIGLKAEDIYHENAQQVKQDCV